LINAEGVGIDERDAGRSATLPANYSERPEQTHHPFRVSGGQ